MSLASEEAALIHGLSNLNLLSVQGPDNTAETAAANVHKIKSAPGPALAGIDHVLDTLREVGNFPFCRSFHCRHPLKKQL